jgi:protein-arginine kinase
VRTGSSQDVLTPYLDACIRKYHKVDAGKKHTMNWSLDGVEGLPEDGKLDLTKLGCGELSMRVRTGRNLKAFPLPGGMSKQDRCDMENVMYTAFKDLIADAAYGGRYVSLTPGHEAKISEEEYQELVKAHIMFKDMADDPYLASAGIASDWPYGRGCYISEDKKFIVWVGEEDHLRIMCMFKGSMLNDVFDRLSNAIKMMDTKAEFAYSPTYGVVTSCPTNLGTGMRASVHIQIPKLTAGGSDAKAKEIMKPMGLSVRGMGGEHTPIGADGTVDISPSARFCISEAEIVTALYKGISEVMAAEEAASDDAERREVLEKRLAHVRNQMPEDELPSRP